MQSDVVVKRSNSQLQRVSQLILAKANTESSLSFALQADFALELPISWLQCDILETLMLQAATYHQVI